MTKVTAESLLLNPDISPALREELEREVEFAEVRAGLARVAAKPRKKVKQHVPGRMSIVGQEK